MIIQVVKKKASSHKDLGHEQIEIEAAATLKELLIAISKYEYNKLYQDDRVRILLQKEIEGLAKAGKVHFSTMYNDAKKEFDQIARIMLEDFQDGLFHVYLNKQECLQLDEPLEINDGDEVVLIRLVMLAGRLW